MDIKELLEQNDFLESISLELSEILDSKINPGLDGIIELTYGYKSLGNNNFFNSTLFNKFCGVEYKEGILIIVSTKEEVSPEELIDIFTKKTQAIIDALESIYKKIQGKNDLTDTNKRDSILKSIQSVIASIQYAQNSIEFELEKIGCIVGITEEERVQRRKNNIKIEEKLYGGKIVDNAIEAPLVVEFLSKLLERYKNAGSDEQKIALVDGSPDRVLSSKEITRLEGYISKIQFEVQKKYRLEIGNQVHQEKTKIHEFLDGVKGVTISRDEVVGIFNGILEFLGLPQRARVGNPGEVQSIYDSPTELVIPDTEKFEQLGVKRVLNLIIHEILCHYINQKNHEDNNGKLRFSGNVPKEEGLAILGEKGHAGEKLLGSDLITPPFSRILAGEILEPDEFEDFIDLFSDISERKGSTKDLINRHNRNQEINIKGVQHKDVAYIRGLIAIVSFLEKGGDIENLFVGKVGLDAIINGDYEFDDETMVFPFLLTDVYLFFLLSQKEGLKFKHSDFLKYIENKYGSVVKKESFKKVTKLLGRKQILELFQILSPISKAINNSGLEDSVTTNIDRIQNILDKKTA